jgi:hypothetical protein
LGCLFDPPPLLQDCDHAEGTRILLANLLPPLLPTQPSLLLLLLMLLLQDCDRAENTWITLAQQAAAATAANSAAAPLATQVWHQFNAGLLRRHRKLVAASAAAAAGGGGDAAVAAAVDSLRASINAQLLR